MTPTGMMFSKLNHRQMALCQVADLYFFHIDMSYAEFVDDLPISLVLLPSLVGWKKPNISGVIFVGFSENRVPRVPRHSLVYHYFSHENGDLVAIHWI